MGGNDDGKVGRGQIIKGYECLVKEFRLYFKSYRNHLRVLRKVG